MNAWNFTPTGRHRKVRAVARVLIVASTMGEAGALWHYGVHADFVGAYLIVAAWAKDGLRRMVTSNRGHSGKESPGDPSSRQEESALTRLHKAAAPQPTGEPSPSRPSRR